MKAEEKKVIAEEFGKLINGSRKSKVFIARFLSITPNYLSMLNTHSEKLPPSALSRMQEAIFSNIEHNWTLDEWMAETEPFEPLGPKGSNEDKELNESEMIITKATAPKNNGEAVSVTITIKITAGKENAEVTLS